MAPPVIPKIDELKNKVKKIQQALEKARDTQKRKEEEVLDAKNDLADAKEKREREKNETTFKDVTKKAKLRNAAEYDLVKANDDVLNIEFELLNTRTILEIAISEHGIKTHFSDSKK